jgi:hypothetical protein
MRIIKSTNENAITMQRQEYNKVNNPCTGLDRPRGSQEDEAPRFQDNRHMKVVRLSALLTGSLYPPSKYSWYSFLLKAESTPGQPGHQRESNPRPSGF